MNRLAQTPTQAQHARTEPLLSVRDLRVTYPLDHTLWPWQTPRVLRAVDGVSFDIQPGETLGLVGESGCGKSTTARAIVNLAPIASGEIRVAGEPISNRSRSARDLLRRTVQMIFQDPYASLNPRHTVGQIVAEPLSVLGLHAPSDRKFEVMRLLDLVGLDPRYLNRYPHEFSGGQRQRIGIARALAAQPRLVVCDEPVSALDVSIQGQIVNLLHDLQQQLGLAYLFISHDLLVVRHIATRVGVMYLGRVVELGPTEQLFEKPRHPYTQALLSAAPVADPRSSRAKERIVLRGELPSADRLYSGCPFADRCPIVQESCREQLPLLDGKPHEVACLRA